MANTIAEILGVAGSIAKAGRGNAVLGERWNNRQEKGQRENYQPMLTHIPSNKVVVGGPTQRQAEYIKERC